MKPIFLIGYMGSGKTTLGRAYASASQMQFIDLDWFIEERFHKTIQEIFSERGEDGFRKIERNMLHDLDVCFLPQAREVFSHYFLC